MFANSPSETKTNTEKAFVAGLGQAGRRHRPDHDVDRRRWRCSRSCSSPGNTMAQAIRERTNELAVLKTLGFGDGRILSLVLLESCFIALVGGGLGPGAVVRVHHGRRAIRRTACCRPFYFPTRDVVVGIGARRRCSGSASGFLPAWQASRLRIVDALRRN